MEITWLYEFSCHTVFVIISGHLLFCYYISLYRRRPTATRTSCEIAAISTPLPTRDRGYLRSYRTLAVLRLLWLPSAIWTGTGTWPPGIAQRPSRRENPLPAGRMTTCVYWWRRSYPGQKKTWPVLRHGGGSLGTRWPGYSLCTPSIGRMCSPG